MNINEFTAYLDQCHIAYARTQDGLTINGKNSVDLSRLTSLPEGVKFENAGSVDLNRLTSLPEGVKFENAGSVYLSSLASLPEGVKFENAGSVYLPSLAEEYHQHRGQTIRLKHIDGSTMLILSERQTGEYTIYHAAYFGGGDLDKLKRCYVVRQGEQYAHGSTVEKAMRDVRFKAMEHDFDEDELVAEIKARGTVLIEDFRLITGACEEGTRHGMQEAGLDPDADELPLSTVLGSAFGPYGERFKSLFAKQVA